MSPPLLLLVLCSLPALADPAAGPAPAQFDARGLALGPPLSQRVTDYEIAARLDPKSNTLTGQETITWLNRGAEPQATLWFHLYWNAFKNGRSTFYEDARRLGGVRTEDAQSPGFPKRKKEDWGYSDVKAVAVRGGADLLPTLRFEHPDDDNAFDQTVFTVTLPRPVPPGERVTLELRWEAHVPKVVERAGHLKDFYLLGQWFPKLGVLELPPERGATRPRWSCHQYHASTEFYADFGTYDVRVTVPKAMKVGATGMLVERRENPDGTATLHYHQDDVHDFAWAASERFEVFEDVFRAPGLPEVGLTVLLEPEHRRSAPQMLQAAKASLEHYGRWWYPFPYPHLTLVAPPAEAAGAGGMEYPTFITVFGREQPGTPRDFLVWQTVAHELGHNYWQGMLASNEFEEAWLDEGINSYGTYKLCLAEDVRVRPEQLLPGPLRGLLGGLVAVDWDERERMELFARSWSSPIIRPAWQYRTLGDYSSNSYDRPQLTLSALEGLVGEETMARILRTYAERWRFRHPRSEDFFAVADEVAGQDLGWFWDDFFRRADTLDYAVDKLSCSEPGPGARAGVFDDGRDGHVLRDGREAGAARETERCVVEVTRPGTLRLPVELTLTFADGTRRSERWDGQDRWRRWLYEREGTGGRIEQAEVDPHGLRPLDATPANDSRTRTLSGHVALALFGWTTYVGQLLSTLASLLT